MRYGQLCDTEIGRLCIVQEYLVGNPKGARAVGMACNRNQIWLLTPCHRVIGSDGSLTGFGGGIEVKRRLLELERRSDSLST